MPDLSGFGTDASATPLLWRADASGLWIWSGPEWAGFTGLSPDDSLGRGWLDAVHADDRAAAAAPWIAEGGTPVPRRPLRIRRSGPGAYRFMQPSASPVRDASGAVREWIGVLLGDPRNPEWEDPAAPRPIAHRRDLGTLQHYMRNTLAIIRSVARRTARTSTTLEHHASHFEGRLDALARVWDAVIRSHDGGVDIEWLISEEMVAHRVEEARARIEGVAVRLQAPAAEAFGLAIHELVLNAVKFGAFCSEGGAVAVTWSVEPGTPDLLRLTWRETGIAVAGPAPRRRGFGTEMIERSLAYDFGAVTRLDFRPGALCCTIALPLTDGVTLLAGR